MNIEEQDRLKETLSRSRKQINSFLTDPKRDDNDLHYIIAGQLRVLLCDAKVPILLYFAKENNIELKIWGPNPPGSKYNFQKNVLDFNALIASNAPEYGAHEMGIEEYLDTPIGAVPEVDPNTNLPKATISYTPKELIKWISNKDGVTHLELKPYKKLEGIKIAIQIEGSVIGFTQTDSFNIRNAIIQIGEWTVYAIDEVLNKT